MNYLTGYDAWSFYYAQCVIVHVNADEPFVLLEIKMQVVHILKLILRMKI
jgi:hypothetical protein